MKNAAFFGIKLQAAPLSRQERAVDEYQLTVHYGPDGRISRAESAGPRGYRSSLRITDYGQDAVWTNSFGDSCHWARGIESSEACFGPFEQSSQEEIGFEQWLDRILVCMIGKNL